jgi:hypothetical protein
LVSLGRRYWWTDSFSLTENGRCSTIALRGIANIVQYIPSQQTLTGNQRNTHTKEPTPQEPVSAETKRNKTKQIREAPANLPCTRELDQDHRPQPKAIEGQPRPGNKLPGNIDRGQVPWRNKLPAIIPHEHTCNRARERKEKHNQNRKPGERKRQELFLPESQSVKFNLLLGPGCDLKFVVMQRLEDTPIPFFSNIPPALRRIAVVWRTWAAPALVTLEDMLGIELSLLSRGGWH